MSTRRPSELILAADFAGSGNFSPVGVVRHPSLALNMAIGDLRLNRQDLELKPVLLHALAARIAGRCTLESEDVEDALMDCQAARLTLEWRITIPAIGAIRALFLITRLEKAGHTASFDLVLQLAGKSSFDALQGEDADDAPAVSNIFFESI